MGISPDSLTVVLAVVQGLLTLVGVLLGWLIKGLFNSIAELKHADGNLAQSVTELRIALPERYVSKSDFVQMGDNIFEALRRIEDKLDRKVDK